MALSPLLATAGLAAVATPADAVVTTGEITVFPDRDMVEAAGYPSGAELTIEVRRGTEVVGSTQGTGPVIEVNHGPAGTPRPGDCWVGPVPNIVGGDVVHVFNASSTIHDSMTVAVVRFAGAPVESNGTVRMKVTGAAAASADVAFRSVDPFFRPEREPGNAFFTTSTDATGITHIFTPRTSYEPDVAGPLTTRQQLDAALDSPWRATVDRTGLEQEVTLAESDGTDGPAPGCPTLAQQLAGEPTITAADPAGNGEIRLTWTAPADTGTTPITEYRIRIRRGLTDVTDATNTTVAGSARTATVGNLTPGTTYTFQVRAVNASGPGPLSDPATATPTGTTPPPPPPVDTVAPTVINRSPAVDAPSVAVGSNVTATFSEDVTGVNGTTFTLRNAATSAEVAASVSATARVATLDPSANLAAGTRYTATLTNGIRDTAATPNALAQVSWSFTTAAATTNVAPRVVGRTPAPNATGVARGINVSARFSEAVTGVSTTSFALRLASATSTSTPIAATVTNPTGNRWVLNPDARLRANTRYRVTLTGGSSAIRDLVGAPLANSPVSWTFRTGS